MKQITNAEGTTVVILGTNDDDDDDLGTQSDYSLLGNAASRVSVVWLFRSFFLIATFN
jgi:hypothetical protein